MTGNKVTIDTIGGEHHTGASKNIGPDVSAVGNVRQRASTTSAEAEARFPGSQSGEICSILRGGNCMRGTEQARGLFSSVMRWLLFFLY